MDKISDSEVFWLFTESFEAYKMRTFENLILNSEV